MGMAVRFANRIGCPADGSGNDNEVTTTQMQHVLLRNRWARMREVINTAQQGALGSIAQHVGRLNMYRAL